MPVPVLLVDDDPSLRRLLSLVMGRAGIESDVAGDAREAIRKLEQTQYSLVLLDLQLGETSGHDVLEWLRAHDHPAGVIVTTGQEDQFGLTAPSILRVMKKPYDLKVVTEEIASLLAVATPARITRALRPGGTLVIHEYFDYGTWRFAQHSPGFDEFVLSVMKAWRETGGEPDIARQLPAWLEDLGLRITSMTPIIDVITPDNFVWQWPKSFVDVGLRRLVDIGELAAERAEEIRNEFVACESAPHARMITPGVLEIIARKS